MWTTANSTAGTRQVATAKTNFSSPSAAAMPSDGAGLVAALAALMLTSPTAAFAPTPEESCVPIYGCLLHETWTNTSNTLVNRTYYNSKRTPQEIWRHFASHDLFRITEGINVVDKFDAHPVIEPYDKYAATHTYDLTPTAGLTIKIYTAWSDPNKGVVFNWIEGCGALGVQIFATLGHGSSHVSYFDLGGGNYTFVMGTPVCQPTQEEADATSLFFRDFFIRVLLAQDAWMAGEPCPECHADDR